MKTETPPPTIAELWGEAESLIKLAIPHYEGLANPKNRVNEERRPIYVAGLAKCNVRLQELRQQLVERCKEVKSSTSNFSCLWINVGKGIVKSENRYSERIDTPETAREMSAAYAFWAWELEQQKREKEAKSEQ